MRLTNQSQFAMTGPVLVALYGLSIAQAEVFDPAGFLPMQSPAWEADSTLATVVLLLDVSPFFNQAHSLRAIPFASLFSSPMQVSLALIIRWQCWLIGICRQHFLQLCLQR